MILYILLDFMIYNNTSFSSFLFLTNIKDNKPLEIIVSILLIYLLTRSLIFILAIILIYILNLFIKINNNFKFYFLINLLNYILFIVIFSFLFQKNLINIFLNSIIIELLFLGISYIFLKKSIYINR